MEPKKEPVPYNWIAVGSGSWFKDGFGLTRVVDALEAPGGFLVRVFEFHGYSSDYQGPMGAPDPGTRTSAFIPAKSIGEIRDMFFDSKYYDCDPNAFYCPSCKKKRPETTEEAEWPNGENPYPCCNELHGVWGTQCYHCHRK